MTTLALINEVTDWWESLGAARQVFFGIGGVSGFIAMVLALLAVLGLEHHDVADGLDADFGHGGSGGIFSVKPLTGFFLGFGWVGGICINQGMSVFAATGSGLLAGTILMATIVIMIRSIYALRSDGTMQISNALGAIGTVYVSLPPAKAAGGQVIVSLQGRQETLPALNAASRSLPCGEKVRVIEVLDERTLLVEPLA